MIQYKFSIGQQVKIQRYNPWIGDYTVSGFITGIGNVFMNGLPTYNIMLAGKELLTEICEKEIMVYS